MRKRSLGNPRLLGVLICVGWVTGQQVSRRRDRRCLTVGGGGQKTAGHRAGDVRCQPTKSLKTSGLATFIAERPWFVHGEPVVAKVTEAVHDHLGVVPEVRDDPLAEPSAVLVLQRLRQIPVVDRAGGGHPVLVRRLDHISVEIESRLVRSRAGTIREDACPGDGEIVLVDAECLLEGG